MKHSVILLVLPFLLSTLALAEKPFQTGEKGKDSFQAEFPSGGVLRVRVRSGELVVKGIDEAKVRVHFEGTNAANLGDVEVGLRVSGTEGELNISGGPRNGFRIILEVPKVVDLHLRMPFGDATVERLSGDKDLEIHAGDLTVDVGDVNDYAHVEASVMSGDLDAGPFDISKAGLFRSFEKSGSGKYRLHAHVGAGDLTLRD
jgi:hypothetical protein